MPAIFALMKVLWEYWCSRSYANWQIAAASFTKCWIFSQNVFALGT